MDHAQWQRILAAGLAPSIKSPEQYVDAFSRHLVEIQKVLKPFPVPSPDILKDIHYDIFHDIYLSAGKFRETLVYFDGGMIGTDPQNLDRELRNICRDGENDLTTAGSIQDQAVAIAVMHGRMRRTHCFIDGNTRTAACVLLSQVKEVFGKDIDLLSADKVPEFKNNLALAYRGIVAPLTNNFILEPIGAELIDHREVTIPKQLFIESSSLDHHKPGPGLLSRMKALVGMEERKMEERKDELQQKPRVSPLEQIKEDARIENERKGANKGRDFGK
jgi:fido (protein-threonine AMPylation protein)